MTDEKSERYSVRIWALKMEEGAHKPRTVVASRSWRR